MRSCKAISNRARSQPQACGVTLTELMVTIAIISILAGITLLITGREWHHEQVNAVATQLEAWLDDVRRTSLRGSPCRVIFLTGLKSAGDPIAMVEAASSSGNDCLSNNPLLTNPLSLDPDLVSSQMEFGPSGAPDLTFTPRGTVLGLPADNSLPLELTLALAGTTHRHCIRISPPIGDISVGKKEQAASASCIYSEDP